MNTWFRAIAVGDRCRFGATSFRVAGVLACLQPDGSFWQEWLLVPEGESPRAAIESRTARWLAWEEDVGGLFWTPIELPAAVVPGEIDGLRSLAHAGRTWRRQERDSYQVARVEGDLGGDARNGERVEYVELLAGTARLCLEWSDSGLDAYEGSKVSAVQVRDAFRAGGAPLDQRALRHGSVRKAEAVERRVAPTRTAWNQDLLGFVIGIVIFIPVLMLENCSSDCTQQRINPQTGKTEYVCANGSVRSSRPWFGK